jgi:4-hydroxythreonine-4-phosphate dehydrogenase
VLQRQATAFGWPVQIVTLTDPSELKTMRAPPPSTHQIPVIACSDLPSDLPIGCVDARAGHAAHAAIVAASRDAIAHKVAAVVTAPIHKEALHAAGVRHPGHTEILAELAGVRDVRMMLANHELRTILVTIHVSLREAIEAMTGPQILQTLRITHQALGRNLGRAPRMAVAGLNPHAGENGTMGSEDLDVIAPAVAQLQAEGIDARGPLPPDTMFHAAARAQYDAALCMYHDQALIPIKTLAFDSAVNLTLGLPFIRTSPDHGTAFDIAGKGVADEASLLAALDLASLLVSRA